MKYAVLIFILVTAVFIVGYLDKPPTKKEQVYTACMKARAEINMFTENYCGALQDDYHTEFICNQANTHCWVESK